MNKASRYKIAFFAALAVIITLAGWLILDWRSAHREKTSVAAEAPTSDAMPDRLSYRQPSASSAARYSGTGS